MADAQVTDFHKGAEMARGPLKFSLIGVYTEMPTAREQFRCGGGGDMNRVWAARDAEQDARNASRSKAWSVRYSDHMRAVN